MYSEEKQMTATPTSKKKQWLWFVGLWLGGFLTLGAVSMGIRAIMNIG